MVRPIRVLIPPAPHLAAMKVTVIVRAGEISTVVVQPALTPADLTIRVKKMVEMRKDKNRLTEAMMLRNNAKKKMKSMRMRKRMKKHIEEERRKQKERGRVMVP